jgi:hypothetical protein
MNTAIEDNISGTPRGGALRASEAPPPIAIRFSPLYAWLGIGFGVLCFFLGLLLALLHPHRDLVFGLGLSMMSAATVIGSNYWRKHLHIVAQLTPEQLILRTDGTVKWSEITAIEKKKIRARYHGTSHESEYVCIRLKNRPQAKNRLEQFLKKAKHGITGYDIIVGDTEISCTADWFIAECQKRMAAAAGCSER